MLKRYIHLSHMKHLHLIEKMWCKKIINILENLVGKKTGNLELYSSLNTYQTTYYPNKGGLYSHQVDDDLT